MIYVALALVASSIVSTVATGQLLRAERRASARERDLLINQLLHAAGRPWVPAPADEPAEPTAVWEPEPVRYTAVPEQFPNSWVGQ